MAGLAGAIASNPIDVVKVGYSVVVAYRWLTFLCHTALINVVKHFIAHQSFIVSYSAGCFPVLFVKHLNFRYSVTLNLLNGYHVIYSDS